MTDDINMDIDMDFVNSIVGGGTSDENTDKKVVILSTVEGFFVKGIETKLNEARITNMYMELVMGEILLNKANAELYVLMTTEEMIDEQDSLVFLKDTMEEMGTKVILVGDKSINERVSRIVGTPNVYDRFNRPVDMDKFIKCVNRYMRNYTGEKRRKNVLIVDDDITYMRMVYEWLKDDYHVGMANSGVQAIGWLAKNPADLVLLDYEMPVANGPQVLSMLKSDTNTGTIPVMFLTGHSERENVLSVVDLKPVDYLLKKSMTKESLLKRLKEFFSSK